MEYKKYLSMISDDVNVLSEKWFKDFIINNSNKYEISSFCSDSSVTSGMIHLLLDSTGIFMIFNNRNRMCMINGIISCGKDISFLYDDDLFLEMLFLLGEYYYYIDEVCACKFMSYVLDKHNDSVVDVFIKFNDKSQLYVISNCDLSSFYSKLLCCCKDCCFKFILDRISSLDDFSYNELISIFGRDVHIPERLISGEFLNKISTMYNVKAYRRLIEMLSYNNDVSFIESMRNKFYDSFLTNCSNIYDLIKNDIESGVDAFFSISRYLNCFGGVDSVLSNIYTTDDIDILFRDSLNYITTDIVIDCLFHDVAYNVLIDIRELVSFASKTGVIDISFYSKVVSLDCMSISDKIAFLNEYKNVDVVSKFYDDYLVCRRKMANLINCSVLNSYNVYRYRNDELSNKYGVPIYEIEGSSFYALVRCSGKVKRSCLTGRDLDVLCDGVSYSLDGSDMLDLYCNPCDYFVIAYDGIPNDQLVHAFEVDSYSNYRRSSNNVPLNSNGTDRINRLYTPSELVNIASTYNELVISQPNGCSDEFNRSLILPRAFAIYCYDDICENDIISARENNLGIIIVKTKCYDNDKSGRVKALSMCNKDITYLNDFSDVRNIKS